MTPTRTEARMFVVSLAGFWICCGLAARFVGAFVGGLAFGVAVFLVPMRVVSRETGIPVHRVAGFALPRRGYRETIAARNTATFLPLRPTWWRAVARTSGWPGWLIAVALVVAAGAPFVRP